jgi:hypothetical protein
MVRLYKRGTGAERVVVMEAWRAYTGKRMGALEGTNTRFCCVVIFCFSSLLAFAVVLTFRHDGALRVRDAQFVRRLGTANLQDCIGMKGMSCRIGVAVEGCLLFACHEICAKIDSSSL